MNGRCSICLDPVSRQPERQSTLVPNEDGGYDHARCHGLGLTPEEVRLREIFGAGLPVRKRERALTAHMATKNGHQITREHVRGIGDRISCSCGWRMSRAMSGPDATRLLAEHQKSAAIYG